MLPSLYELLGRFLICENVEIFLISHYIFSLKVIFRMSKGEIYLVGVGASGVELIT